MGKTYNNKLLSCIIVIVFVMSQIAYCADISLFGRKSKKEKIYTNLPMQKFIDSVRQAKSDIGRRKILEQNRGKTSIKKDKIDKSVSQALSNVDKNIDMNNKHQKTVSAQLRKQIARARRAASNATKPNKENINNSNANIVDESSSAEDASTTVIVDPQYDDQGRLVGYTQITQDADETQTISVVTDIDNFEGTIIVDPQYDDQGRLVGYTQITQDADETQTVSVVTDIQYDSEDRVISYTEYTEHYYRNITVTLDDQGRVAREIVDTYADAAMTQLISSVDTFNIMYDANGRLSGQAVATYGLDDYGNVVLIDLQVTSDITYDNEDRISGQTVITYNDLAMTEPISTIIRSDIQYDSEDRVISYTEYTEHYYRNITVTLDDQGRVVDYTQITQGVDGTQTILVVTDIDNFPK